MMRRLFVSAAFVAATFFATPAYAEPPTGVLIPPDVWPPVVATDVPPVPGRFDSQGAAPQAPDQTPADQPPLSFHTPDAGQAPASDVTGGRP